MLKETLHKRDVTNRVKNNEEVAKMIRANKVVISLLALSLVFAGIITCNMDAPVAPKHEYNIANANPDDEPPDTPQDNTYKTNGLIFKVWTDKKEYSVGEQIIANVRLSNGGNKIETNDVFDIGNGGLTFELANPLSETIQMYYIPLPGIPNRTNLNPGQFMDDSYEINPWSFFGIIWVYEGTTNEYFITNTGIYQIKANYWYTKTIGTNDFYLNLTASSNFTIK